MKCERFIKEYASYQIKCIKGYDLMQVRYKYDAIENCKRAVALRERGLITVDEAIGIIKNCFTINREEKEQWT